MKQVLLVMVVPNRKDLNPPASEELLAKVEANIGMKLPPAFRQAYLEHNGEVEGAGG